MNEQQLQQIRQQLADIELPPEPNWWPLIWTVAAVVLGLLIAALLRWKKSRPTATATLADQAPQRLQQLQQQWQTGELDQRTTAYQLATLLRIGLNLKQLDHNAPESLTDQQQQWQKTIKLLQQLRYQPNNNAQLDKQTFITIATWLRETKPC